MSEYQAGDEVEWNYNRLCERAPAQIIAGPFPSDSRNYYVIKIPPDENHRFASAEHLRPKPTPPEYEYLCFLRSDIGGVSLLVWDHIEPKKPHSRREKGKPETIEWIPNE